MLQQFQRSDLPLDLQESQRTPNSYFSSSIPECPRRRRVEKERKKRKRKLVPRKGLPTWSSTLRDWMRFRSRIFTATACPVSTWRAYFTFPKFPSPRVLPISYFPSCIPSHAGELPFVSLLFSSGGDDRIRMMPSPETKSGGAFCRGRGLI